MEIYDHVPKFISCRDLIFRFDIRGECKEASSQAIHAREMKDESEESIKKLMER